MYVVRRNNNNNNTHVGPGAAGLVLTAPPTIFRLRMQPLMLYTTYGQRVCIVYVVYVILRYGNGFYRSDPLGGVVVRQTADIHGSHHIQQISLVRGADVCHRVTWLMTCTGTPWRTERRSGHKPFWGWWSVYCIVRQWSEQLAACYGSHGSGRTQDDYVRGDGQRRSQKRDGCVTRE